MARRFCPHGTVKAKELLRVGVWEGEEPDACKRPSCEVSPGKNPTQESVAEIQKILLAVL